VVTEAQLLRFPADYPIKVLGRPSEAFRARIHGIFLKHAPDVDPDRITERLSASGNFVAITYTIVATGKEQIVALAEELAACEGVMLVI
jgi:putative lipoic acid-binding regulatory protein